MSLKDLAHIKPIAITPEFVKMVSPDLPLVPSRFCLIFGNRQRENVHNMAVHASHLYHTGMVKKIIVTGGVAFVDNKDKSTEAQYARKILLARGVPAQKILFENRSTNTRENVVNAKRLIQKHGGTKRGEPMICLGMNHATSRFLMTLAQNWPEITPTFMGFDRLKLEKDMWHTCPQIASLLAEDQAKWDNYIAQRHIKPVDITNLKRRIAATSKPRKLSR